MEKPRLVIRKYGFFVKKVKDVWRIHWNWQWYASHPSLFKALVLFLLKKLWYHLENQVGYYKS